jgi:uncharacterized Zn finger protein
MSLSELITKARLIQLAGERSFERGEEYFAGGAVRDLRERGDSVRANVDGTQTYGTQLGQVGRELDYRCTCPFHTDEGEFCKHLVATGLAWLHNNGAAEITAKQASSRRRKPSIESWLRSREPDELVDLLLAAAHTDARLHRMLSLKAEAGSSGDGQLLAAFKKRIAQVVRTGNYYDYHEAAGLAQEVDELVDEIETACLPSKPAVVLDLVEKVIAAVGTMLETVDDSDGVVGATLDRLGQLHASTAAAAKIEPRQFAKRFYDLRLLDEWDALRDLEAYKPALGKAGLTVLRDLAQADWKKYAQLQPGSRQPPFDSRRFAIQSLLEGIAQLEGDTETLVEIKSRDLSSAHCFLAIAKIYAHAKQHERALEWAERGLATFERAPNEELEPFVAGAYMRRRRFNEALALIWRQYAREPGLHGYRQLLEYAKRAKAEPAWRDRALECLREAIGKAKNKTAYSYPRDHSSLVEIFLWEGNLEAAWTEAQAGGCADRLWLQLADMRAKTHPSDAITVYRRNVDQLVPQTNNDAYAQAFALIGKTGELLRSGGQGRAFGDYLAELRVNYKTKRNFIKLLDAIKP